MLTRVLRTVALDTIDRRSQVGVALRRTRDELVEHVGGEPTGPQRILIDEIAKARVIAAVVGEYLLRQETLVRGDGTLLPVVVEHAALVGNLTRMLRVLNFRRSAQPLPTLREYIRSRDAHL